MDESFLYRRGGFARQGNPVYLKQSIAVKVIGCLASGEANTRVEATVRLSSVQDTWQFDMVRIAIFKSEPLFSPDIVKDKALALSSPRHCFSGIAEEWWLVMSHREPSHRYV
jgi:hypothetical protein